jgi:hypothetical protein
MAKPRIIYRARDDTTPEGEAAALSRVYAFLLEASRKRKATRPGGPTTRKRSPSMTAPQRSIQDDPNLLAAIRELYSRLPETRCLEPYELQGTLWLLHYTDDLAPVAELAAAVEVARSDFDPEGAAA